MPTDKDPVMDTWYREQDGGKTFFVTGIDEENELIEIQDYDGDVTEIGAAEWSELDLDLAEPPEDWSGPVDRLDKEDLDDGESAARRARPAGTP